MGASNASHSSKSVGIKHSPENSIIQVYVISVEGELQHCWNNAIGGNTIADLREQLRTRSRLANGRVQCNGRVLADSETLGSLPSTLVERPSGKKVFDLSLTIDGFVQSSDADQSSKPLIAKSVPQTPETQVMVEVSSSAGDLVSSMDATSETTVVELNVRLQKNSHGFQKLLFNGRILADFETIGSLCANSLGATMSKVSLQSVCEEPFVFAFECFQAKQGNIKTTRNIKVDQITSEVLDRVATPDPLTFSTKESHSWLLGILRGAYSAVLDSNPEHAERLMALVSSPPADVKVLRYSQGKIYTGLRKSTNEVLIAGHRLMLVEESRVENDVAPAPAPAPTRSHNSDTYPPLAEEANAMEEKWPAGVSATVLTIDIQTHDDIRSIHVSCQTLSGETAMSSNFPAEATLVDLESKMKSSLKWLQLEFVSENGTVNTSEPLKAYRTLNAKKVPFSSLPSIDRQKCRRCGGEKISYHRTVEWCKMNGDAGGQETSTCKTCGLHMTGSWSDD